MSTRVPRIVTFSGIDGAGKTTQIDFVCRQLAEQGYRVARMTFWDDAAFMPKLRADLSLSLLRKRPTASQQSALRNDKNVRTWYLMMVRVVLYFLDALRLRRVVSRLQTKKHDFVIFDRYLYDQLAQIRARHWLARAYIRLLLFLAPTPEFAFVLDASPYEVFLRKPEYPLDFMYDYRRAFLGLCRLIPEVVVIEPASIARVGQSIMQHLSEGIWSRAERTARLTSFRLGDFQ